MIRDADKKPVGVISKTGLIIAYHHGRTPGDKARSIMSSPVQSCRKEDLIADALRHMLIKGIQRLFVRGDDEFEITEALSLTDAAQHRSGTCRACMPSRLMD